MKKKPKKQKPPLKELEFLTPPEVAKLLRISVEKVLNWIRKAELKAIDVSNGGQRSRYRISQESLKDFLKLREVPPPIPRTPRRKAQEACPDGGPIDPELGKELEKKGQARKSGNKYYRVWNGRTLYV